MDSSIVSLGGAGVEPQLIHIPSDFIGACVPEALGSLKGDKAVSVVFDNSKIKRYVPGYCATVPFAEGIRRTLAWFDADPARRQIDADANVRWDKLIAAYAQGAAAAARLFQRKLLWAGWNLPHKITST
jgi:hypothetical protein